MNTTINADSRSQLPPRIGWDAQLPQRKSATTCSADPFDVNQGDLSVRVTGAMTFQNWQDGSLGLNQGKWVKVFDAGNDAVFHTAHHASENNGEFICAA